jgi:NitT/TauT family transport system permease protein/taurine transport system permease protein
MLTSANRIGYLVTKNRTTLDSPRVFAAIVIILFLAIPYDIGMRMVECRTLVWQTAGRRDRSSADTSERGAPAPSVA